MDIGPNGPACCNFGPLQSRLELCLKTSQEIRAFGWGYHKCENGFWSDYQAGFVASHYPSIHGERYMKEQLLDFTNIFQLLLVGKKILVLQVPVQRWLYLFAKMNYNGCFMRMLVEKRVNMLRLK